MSAWRRRAIACCPRQRTELEQPDTTIYGAFRLLLWELISAHEANNCTTVERIYDFAAWCHRQPHQELWNAAGVSFYEHLVDREITRKAMPAWISRALYLELRLLFEARITATELRDLDKHFSATPKSKSV